MIDEGIVADIEVQCAHDAGHAQHVHAHGEACHGGGEPEVCRRENAGRSHQIAFHQCIHSDIGPTRC